MSGRKKDITAELEKGHQELDGLIAAFCDGLSYDEELFIRLTRKDLEAHFKSGIQAGKKLVVIKAHTPHGRFQEIVEQDLGMHPETARNYMRLAVKFVGVDEEVLKALGVTKLYRMLAAPKETFDGFIETGEFLDMSKEELVSVSVRELEKRIKEATAFSRAELDAEKEKTRKQFDEIQRLQNENQLLKDPTHADPIFEDTVSRLMAAVMNRSSKLMLYLNDHPVPKESKPMTTVLFDQFEGIVMRLRQQMLDLANPDWVEDEEKLRRLDAQYSTNIDTDVEEGDEII